MWDFSVGTLNGALNFEVAPKYWDSLCNSDISTSTELKRMKFISNNPSNSQKSPGSNTFDIIDVTFPFRYT